MAISGRYVRFRATGGRGIGTYNKHYSIVEAEAFASTDCTGDDMTEGRHSTAVASSEFDASYPAEYAFDDDAGTRWACAIDPLDYQWIYVDLGSSKYVRSVSIKFDSGAYTPETMAIDMSPDATNWTEIAEVTVADSTAVQEFYDLQSGSSGHFPLINGSGRAGKLVS